LELVRFLHCAVETHWQRFEQFLNDFQKLGLGLPYQEIGLSYQKSVSKIGLHNRFSLSKIGLQKSGFLIQNRTKSDGLSYQTSDFLRGV